jgi:hypothetical protein
MPGGASHTTSLNATYARGQLESEAARLADFLDADLELKR